MKIHNLDAVYLWLKLTKGWEFINEKKKIIILLKMKYFTGHLSLSLKNSIALKSLRDDEMKINQ